MEKYYRAGQRGHCRDCVYVDRSKGSTYEGGLHGPLVCHGECEEIRRRDLAVGSNRRNGVWDNDSCGVTLTPYFTLHRWQVYAFVPLTDKVVRA